MAGFGYFPGGGGGGGGGAHPDLTGRTTTNSHPGTAISLTAPDGDGNLADTVVNVQLLSAAVDALDLGSGGSGGGLFLFALFHYNVDIGALSGLPPIPGLKVGFNAQTTGSQNGYYLTNGSGGVDTGSKVVIRELANLGLSVVSGVNFYDQDNPPDFNGAEDLWPYLNLNGSVDLPEQQGAEAFTVTTNDGSNFLLTPVTVAPGALLGQVLRLTSMNDHRVTGPATIALGVQGCIVTADTNAGDVTATMGIHDVVPRITLFENIGTGNLFVEHDPSETAFDTTIPPGCRGMVIADQNGWKRWDLPPIWNSSDLIYDKDKFIRFTEDGDLIRDHVVHQYEVLDVGVPGGGWVIEDRDVNYIRYKSVDTLTSITLPNDARHVVWIDCPRDINPNTAGGAVYRTGVGTPLFEIAPGEVWMAKCYFGNHWTAVRVAFGLQTRQSEDSNATSIGGIGGTSALLSWASGLPAVIHPISECTSYSTSAGTAAIFADNDELRFYPFSVHEPIPVDGWSFYGEYNGPSDMIMRILVYRDRADATDVGGGGPVGDPLIDSQYEGTIFHSAEHAFTEVTLTPGRYWLGVAFHEMEVGYNVTGQCGNTASTGFGLAQTGRRTASGNPPVWTMALEAIDDAPTDPMDTASVQPGLAWAPDVELMVVTTI